MHVLQCCTLHLVVLQDWGEHKFSEGGSSSSQAISIANLERLQVHTLLDALPRNMIVSLRPLVAARGVFLFGRNKNACTLHAERW